MTSVQTAVTKRAVSIPDDIESPRAKLVYLYLSTTEAATIEELQEALGMKKITLYSLLSTLEKRELIRCIGEQYVRA